MSIRSYTRNLAMVLQTDEIPADFVSKIVKLTAHASPITDCVGGYDTSPCLDNLQDQVRRYIDSRQVVVCLQHYGKVARVVMD